MKTLKFPFVEIEVPDDFPSGLDFEAIDRYVDNHPEVADQIIYQYETAYKKWQKMQHKNHAKKPKPHKTETRNQQVPSPLED
jgi:hypothetical protein